MPRDYVYHVVFSYDMQGAYGASSIPHEHIYYSFEIYTYSNSTYCLRWPCQKQSLSSSLSRLSS